MWVLFVRNRAQVPIAMADDTNGEDDILVISPWKVSDGHEHDG